LIGFCGYLRYGNQIQDNVINNLNKTDIAVVICRLAVGMLVALSYPLQIHPLRICLYNILQIVFPRIRDSNIPFFIVTILVCAVTYAVGFFVSDLGIVFSIVGATGSVSICYILPGLFYTSYYWDRSWFSKKFFSALMVVVGVIFMVNSLTWIIIKETRKNNPI